MWQKNGAKTLGQPMQPGQGFSMNPIPILGPKCLKHTSTIIPTPSLYLESPLFEQVHSSLKVKQRPNGIGSKYKVPLISLPSLENQMCSYHVYSKCSSPLICIYIRIYYHDVPILLEAMKKTTQN
jgi:hypothetical protein